jgi:ATP-dependent DNA ligase
VVSTELAEMLKPMRDKDNHPWKDWADFQDSENAQRKPGATSRWNRGKDLTWEPIKIGLVAEVAFDHMQGSRFRHATHFKRWRPDKPASDCRYDQLEVSAPQEIKEIFGMG